MRDPDEHYRYHEGDDVAEWQRQQMDRIFAPLTFRERIWLDMKENPEFWIALSCALAVIIVQVFG